MNCERIIVKKRHAFSSGLPNQLVIAVLHNHTVRIVTTFTYAHYTDGVIN